MRFAALGHVQCCAMVWASMFFLAIPVWRLDNYVDCGVGCMERQDARRIESRSVSKVRLKMIQNL